MREAGGAGSVSLGLIVEEDVSRTVDPPTRGPRAPPRTGRLQIFLLIIKCVLCLFLWEG